MVVNNYNSLVNNHIEHDVQIYFQLMNWHLINGGGEDAEKVDDGDDGEVAMLLLLILLLLLLILLVTAMIIYQLLLSKYK